MNKPGGMPCHSTISNHAKDVMSMLASALKQRHIGTSTEHPFLSLPLRVEPEMHGLIVAATKKEFCTFMTKQLESMPASESDGVTHPTTSSNTGVSKRHRSHRKDGESYH